MKRGGLCCLLKGRLLGASPNVMSHQAANREYSLALLLLFLCSICFHTVLAPDIGVQLFWLQI
ncbi:hypothetical protein DL89DRAFT_270105, partial [Linderina pennispora]